MARTRSAGVPSANRNTTVHVLHFIFFAKHFELMAQVGNHAAGNLMHILGVIVFRRFAYRQIVLLCTGREVIGYGAEWLFIDHDLKT